MRGPSLPPDPSCRAGADCLLLRAGEYRRHASVYIFAGQRIYTVRLRAYCCRTDHRYRRRRPFANFNVRVTDRGGLSSTRQFSLNIIGRQSPGTLPVEIATTTLPQGNVDRLYAFIFTARNGVPPYRWAISGLPAGLEANAYGEIIGTPQRAGTSTIQVVVTDDARGRATGTFNLVIKPPQVIIVTERAPDGRVDEPYSVAFAATGGSPPYTFSIGSGSFPPGVAISNAGVVSGTPTGAGSYQFAIQATDSAGEKGSRGFTVAVKPPPLVITTATLGNGVVAFPFGTTLAASGGTPPYKWSATGLPEGVAIDAPQAPSRALLQRMDGFTVSVQVTDQDNQNASRSYPVEIATQLSITTLTVGNLVVGTPVSTPLAAAGGKPPYSWSVLNGSLPPGVTLSADGVISGTPTETGDSNFTAQVRDANNTVASKSFSVRVVTPLVLTTQTIPPAPFGASYSTSLTATGGTPPYTWSIASGNLPARTDTQQCRNVDRIRYGRRYIQRHCASSGFGHDAPNRPTRPIRSRSNFPTSRALR